MRIFWVIGWLLCFEMMMTMDLCSYTSCEECFNDENCLWCDDEMECIPANDYCSSANFDCFPSNSSNSFSYLDDHFLNRDLWIGLSLGLAIIAIGIFIVRKMYFYHKSTIYRVIR